jgi:hypothetical protein
MAVPCVNTIKPPKINTIIIIGNNQYFFLIDKNFINSAKKDISKLIFHTVIVIVFINPVTFIIIFF